MDEQTLLIADKFGITKKVKELETALLKVDYAVEVEFDLSGFYDELGQMIFLVKYDIPVSLSDYYNVLNKFKSDIVSVAREYGLSRTGDRIEDYGEHFYFVFDCDESWSEKTIE